MSKFQIVAGLFSIAFPLVGLAENAADLTGLDQEAIRQQYGSPSGQMRMGDRALWIYPGKIITFEQGHVTVIERTGRAPEPEPVEAVNGELESDVVPTAAVEERQPVEEPVVLLQRIVRLRGQVSTQDFWALEQLAIADEYEERVLALLIRILRLPDDRWGGVDLTRTAAAVALGNSGAPNAVEPLIRALSATRFMGASETRASASATAEAAAEALGRLGDARAVPPLIKLIEDDDNDLLRVRIEAAAALAELDDPRAIEPLIARQGMLEDDFTSELGAITAALGRITDPAARLHLEQVARRRWRATEARKESIRALGDRGDPASVKTMQTILRRDRGPVQVLAAEALAKIGDPSACEALFAVLISSRDAEVNHAATEALTRLGAAGAEKIARALEHPQAVVRYRVAAALLALVEANEVDNVPDRLLLHRERAEQVLRDRPRILLQPFDISLKDDMRGNQHVEMMHATQEGPFLDTLSDALIAAGYKLVGPKQAEGAIRLEGSVEIETRYWDTVRSRVENALGLGKANPSRPAKVSLRITLVIESGPQIKRYRYAQSRRGYFKRTSGTEIRSHLLPSAAEMVAQDIIRDLAGRRHVLPRSLPWPLHRLKEALSSQP